MIVGVIYNPPPPLRLSNRDFLDKLEETLHKIYLIRSEGFNQPIFEATRITEKTQSCIDHIHSNFASTCTSGSIAIELADHLPVFTILYDPDISPFPDSIEYRDFKNFKSKSFKSQRVGRGVPGVLVWSLFYFMIHGMGGLGEVANGLMAAACGAYIC